MATYNVDSDLVAASAANVYADAESQTVSLFA